MVALRLFLPETVEFTLGEKVAIVLKSVTLRGFFSNNLIMVLLFVNCSNQQVIQALRAQYVAAKRVLLFFWCQCHRQKISLFKEQALLK